MRPRLKQHQLRADDSPKDLINFNPSMTYSANHTPVLRAVDILNAHSEKDASLMEKAPLHASSDAPVITAMSDLSSCSSSEHTVENETEKSVKSF